MKTLSFFCQKIQNGAKVCERYSTCFYPNRGSPHRRSIHTRASIDLSNRSELFLGLSWLVDATKWREGKGVTSSGGEWNVNANNNTRAVFQATDIYTRRARGKAVKVSRSETASDWRHPAVRSALSSRPPRQREVRVAADPRYIIIRSH